MRRIFINVIDKCNLNSNQGNLRDSVFNVLDCNFVVSQLDLQLYDDVHFRTNTIEKSLNPLSPTTILSIVQQHFHKDGFGIK